jgi:hypothetical protein
MEINKIKFSHNGYCKLYGQTSGILVYVTILNSKDLHPDLVEYDTKFTDEGDYDDYHTDFEGDIEHRHYPLPEGELVQLTFIGNKRIPFCTIRSRRGRYGDKFEYYKDRIGQEFEIVIKKT